MADLNLSLGELPLPPQGLVDAAEGGKLVLFIGAGVSRLAGSPGWDGFSTALLNWLVSRGMINHSVRVQLSTLPLKTRLSIALSIAEKQDPKLTSADYRDMLMTRNPDEKSIGHELYRNLTSISRYYVTTNYDEWLEFTYPEATLSEAKLGGESPLGQRQLVCFPTDLTIANMLEGRVIHLHGSLTQPNTMIFTTNRYLTHYRNDRATEQNPVTYFLHYLFQKGGWTVLFIGYGLEEMEILEYVLQKSHVFEEQETGGEVRHYLLRGFYSYESALIPHLDEYYAQHCGVRLIPFSLDGKDHPQLLKPA